MISGIDIGELGAARPGTAAAPDGLEAHVPVVSAQDMADAVAQGSQFVIATHSPLLLAVPGARILSFDETPLGEVAWGELESVRLWRDVLAAPDRFMRHLWNPEG